MQPVSPSSPTPATLYCYRHPERETLLRCARCDRPICGECQVRHPVGIRCPECSPGRGTGAVNARLQRRQAAVTWTLLAVNVVVWVLMELRGGSSNSAVLVAFGAKVNWLISTGEVWRLFTAMFLHIGILHLLVNAYSLYNLGTLLEPLLGWRRFAAVYVLSGLCGSLASYQFNPQAVSAGASGAIFGLVGAIGVFFLLHRKVFGRVSTRMLGNIGVIALINLVFGLRTPGIDNFAHLGGVLGGVVVGALLAPRYGGMLLDRPQLYVKDNGGARAWLLTLLFALALAGATWYAIQLNSNSAESYLGRAEDLFANNRNDEAAALFQKALQRDPHAVEAHYYLGLIAYERSDFGAASQSLEAALRLAPQDASTHYNLGLCYAQLGRFADARAQFEQTLQLTSNGNLRARATDSLRRLEGK